MRNNKNKKSSPFRSTKSGKLVPKYVPKRYTPDNRQPIIILKKVYNTEYTFEVLMPNDPILKNTNVQEYDSVWTIGSIVQLDATTVALCISIQDNV